MIYICLPIFVVVRLELKTPMYHFNSKSFHWVYFPQCFQGVVYGLENQLLGNLPCETRLEMTIHT